MHQIRTHHQHVQGRVFAWMALIVALSSGLIKPIFPNFVKLFVGSEEYVSLFYTLTAFIILLAPLVTTIIFRKIARTLVTKISLLISSVTFLLFIFVTRFTSIFIIETIRIWLEMTILIAIGLFVRDFAKTNNLAETEGYHYRFQNIGVLIGPLVGGFIAIKFGYELVFVTAALTTFAAYAYFYHKHVILHHPAIIDDHKKADQIVFSNIKKFFSSAQRTQAYLVTLCFMLWVSFKRLYVPLYVVSLGYLESMSGLILSLSVLPLILMEVRVGHFGDKHGYRKIISLGFLLMSLFLMAIFFNPFTVFNFLLLIYVNFGGSLIESLQEPLLFKDVDKSEEDQLYGVYMTADPLAFFLAPLIGSIILFFLPFEFLFLVFGLILFTMSLFTWAKLKY